MTADGGRPGPAAPRWPAFALGAAAAAAALAASGTAAALAVPGAAVAPLRAAAVGAAAVALALAARRRAVRTGAATALGRALLGAGTALAVAAAFAAMRGHLPGAVERASFLPRDGGGYRAVLAGGLRGEVVAPGDVRQLPFPPLPRRRRVRTLVVGFPNGEELARLLARRRTRVLVVGGEAGFVAEVSRRWPALAEARRTGKVRLLSGNPRHELARLRRRFDLVVVGEGWSAEARIAGALNRRPDHLMTREAFREYLRLLEPEGYLLVERAGAARALLTLRAAAGAGEGFAERIAVLGHTGGGRSRIWYRPAGLADDGNTRALVRAARAAGLLVFYRPYERRRWNFYFPLVTGAHPAGLAFSTPQDLAPNGDDRPYFDHAGRVRLTPTGALLPDEPHRPGDPRRTRLVPPGDGTLLLALVAALALLAAGAAWRRDGEAFAPAALGGVQPALVLPAAAAWSSLAAPTATAAAAACAGAVAGAGAGWLLGACSRRPGAWVVAGALAAAGACAGAYPLAGRLLPLGAAPGAAAVAALATVAGLAAGAAGGAAAAGMGARAGAAPARVTAVALAAAGAAWSASPLLAASFGYRLHWALAAAAAAGALLARRSPRAARA